MTTEVNQKGYDVVSADGEKISVKTTAMMGSNGHVSFNPNSLDMVDRVIILRMNTEEMQIETLLNAPREQAVTLMAAENGGKRVISLSRLVKPPKPACDLKAVKEASHEEYTIWELENGTIELHRAGAPVNPVLPALRELAKRLNVSILNSNGNPFNTRQLGSQIVKSLQEP